MKLLIAAMFCAGIAHAEFTPIPLCDTLVSYSMKGYSTNVDIILKEKDQQKRMLMLYGNALRERGMKKSEVYLMLMNTCREHNAVQQQENPAQEAIPEQQPAFPVEKFQANS